VASAGIDGFDLNFDVGWLAKAVDINPVRCRYEVKE
jgi:hypothetical protein